MASRFRLRFFVSLGLCCAPLFANAQGTREDYQRASQFLPGNLRHRIYIAEFTPHWIAKTSRFWYRKAGMTASEFILVDPAQNSAKPPFDHERLAKALSDAAKREYKSTELPFDTIDFSDDLKSLHFQIESTDWRCDLDTYKCKPDRAAEAGQYESLSPDKNWIAFIKDYNLYLRYIPTGTVSQLTHDGERGWSYATPISGLRPMVAQGTDDIRQRPAVFWSEDSSKFVTYRMDTRTAGRFTNLQFVPPGQLRPRAFSVVYPLPGEVLPTAAPIIFDVHTGARSDVKTPPIEMQFQGGPGFEWFPDNKTFQYQVDGRGIKSIELRVVDAETGEQKVVMREQNEKYVDPGETYSHIIKDTGEVLWTSERDGWNHLYLYDLRTGAQKAQLTQGQWVVRQLLDVDEKARRVFFTAAGREKGEDPYQTHLYSIGLDAKNLTLLTPENATHVAFVSPDHLYFVESASRPDLPAQVILRSAKDGSQIRVLEQSDVTQIQQAGWKFPEAFQGKATDGKTDLYGLIWRPSNFDSSKKYPVIEMIYTGPQGFFVPKNFAQPIRSLQSMAELGFIMVMVDGRGTTGRSRAFHEYSYHNLGGAFEDHVAMIKQMAEKHPYMDITRVGIYGTSAGGYGSAHAILTFPDFYKVCVSISGDHDARLDKAWWNELYQGYPVGKDYEEQSNVTLAGNLKGRLLIEHGDIDDNVHVVETMRFADALIKANKDFDMLIVPNMYHGEGGNLYLVRRRWDYFVRYLLGVTPPENFEIHEDPLPTFGRPQ